MFTKRICIINWWMYKDISQKPKDTCNFFFLYKFHAVKSIHKESPTYPPQQQKFPVVSPRKIPTLLPLQRLRLRGHSSPNGSAGYGASWWFGRLRGWRPFLPPVAVWWFLKGLAAYASWGTKRSHPKSQLGRYISFSQLVGYVWIYVSFLGG